MQMIIVGMDRLLAYRIINTAAIVNWVFHDETLRLFSRNYLWDSLFGALDIVSQRVVHFQEKLAQVCRTLCTEHPVPPPQHPIPPNIRRPQIPRLVSACPSRACLARLPAASSLPARLPRCPLGRPCLGHPCVI